MKIFKLLNILALFILFTSCKKNNIAVDKDPITLGARAQFLTSAFTQNYYVKSSGNELALPIGITTKSANTTVVNLSYTSPTGAVAGTHYTAPSTLNIAAGNVIDSLRIKGIFSAYSTGRKDSIKVKLSTVDGVGISGKDSMWVILQRYCDVTSAIAGVYANSNEYSSSGAFSYGPYNTSITNFVATSATTATCKFVNLYDDGWNDISATLDWSNPAAFKVTIPLQATGKSYSGAPTSVRTNATKTSTFSSCDQVFNIYIDLVNNGTTVITSNYEFRLKR